MIEIELDKKQQRFLLQVFQEVFGGGSTCAIQNILGETVAHAKTLKPVVEKKVGEKNKPIALSSEQWRVVYESINAVMYGLGPFELQTCTNSNVQDALNLNLRICTEVWGAFGEIRWE